ncbi:hypothetical protein FS749_016440 [Ceratobasidium sp. UAMH 11750]|nr:hypothetical protein FS749_016440 [Ceratobasidium sp. UAMH 11750]
MARYREKHPCIIFPSNMTHTPPPLPAHIPVELEPVTGPPSNEQIKSVQNALRLSENLANVPSMFDANLSMKLSQHLFNIQFERYLRQVADGDRSAPVATTRVKEVDSNHSDRGNSDVGDTGSIDEPPGHFVMQPSTAARPILEQTQHVLSETQSNPTEMLETGLEDTKQLLVRMTSTLENVNRVLIAAQQNMARGLNTTRYHEYSGLQHNHVLVNEKGEDPRHQRLPSILTVQYNLVNRQQVQDTDIARYLRFYGIGAEFIEGGDVPTIKEGKIDEAKAELRSYLGV